MQIKSQLAQIKTLGYMQKSADVMKTMQELIKLPELTKQVQELSKELITLGIIDEIFEEALDSGEDVDAMADEEVEKVLQEVIQGKIKNLPNLPSSLSSGDKKKEKKTGRAADNDDDDDVEAENEISRRLDALRS